ncbi:translation initiation factor IF-2-like [Vidua chalybeata]|uniref:translation initiation factor IF-2-like n=1 Tax=Vidua chalybeata TaxID=81927 RepID=UPI0023A7A71A|nr:translation initiation factor IF-2-like [Vidua chalybeata]
MAAPLPAGALPPPPAPSLPRAADTGSPDRRRQHRARPGLPGRDGAQGLCVCLSRTTARRRGAGRRAGLRREGPPCLLLLAAAELHGHRERRQGAAAAPPQLRRPGAGSRTQPPPRAGGASPAPPGPSRWAGPRGASLPPARPSELSAGRRGSAVAPSPSSSSPCAGRRGSAARLPSLPRLPFRGEWRGGGLAPRPGPWPGAASVSLPASEGRLCPGIHGAASPPSASPSPLSPRRRAAVPPQPAPPAPARRRPEGRGSPRNSAGAFSNNKGLEAGRRGGRQGRPAGASRGILGAVGGGRLLNGRFWNGIAAVLSSPSDLPLQRNSPPSVPWLKGAR